MSLDNRQGNFVSFFTVSHFSRVNSVESYVAIDSYYLQQKCSSDTLVVYLSNAMHGIGQIYNQLNVGYVYVCPSVRLSEIPIVLDSDRSFCPISIFLKFEM